MVYTCEISDDSRMRLLEFAFSSQAVVDNIYRKTNNIPHPKKLSLSFKDCMMQVYSEFDMWEQSYIQYPVKPIGDADPEVVNAFMEANIPKDELNEDRELELIKDTKIRLERIINGNEESKDFDLVYDRFRKSAKQCLVLHSLP